MKVLVIDDNRALRMGAEMVLQDHHEVRLAASGEEGLECVALEEFDVVVCDLQMPGIGGLEVRERLPEGLRSRFVLWTGAPEGVESGIKVVAKPSSTQELKDAILEVSQSQERPRA